jgi:hypothetical protein
MRALTLTACVVLFAASHGSALAASGCGKGMLWPYVRQPGDCLTDDEIKAGTVTVKNLAAQTQATYDQSAASAAILEALRQRG